MVELPNSQMQLRYLGDICLTTRAQPIENVTADTHRLVKSMEEVLFQHRGAAIAAPQVGVSKRLFLIDTGLTPFACINPTVTDSSGEVTVLEGCLSIPGVFFEVTRPAEVAMNAWSQDGSDFNLELTGRSARAVQHEIDHLDGTLLVDTVNDEQRAAFETLTTGGKLTRPARHETHIFLDGSIETI